MYFITRKNSNSLQLVEINLGFLVKRKGTHVDKEVNIHKSYAHL